MTLAREAKQWERQRVTHYKGNYQPTEAKFDYNKKEKQLEDHWKKRTSNIGVLSLRVTAW